jgi:Putative beta-barrel porin-2, OmpL-like. bbp2
MNRRSFACSSRAALLGLAAAGIAGLPTLAGAQSQAPAAPTSNAMTTPALTGPITANPNPLKFDGGPLGPVYVTGVLSGFGMAQSNHTATDKTARFDITNGQAIVQNTSGMVQFYAEAGIYSLPALGASYVTASKLNSQLYGPLPVGYLKLAPSDSFSIQAGKLPTLIGAEYTFTFENMNIERGLLWAQEPAVSDGVQGNYSVGPFSFSVSLNDGLYSGNYDWLSGLATWTINGSNSLSVAAGGNFGQSNVSTVATPEAQNNGSILNVIYTYSAAPWTITPYVQVSNVPKNASLGIGHDTQTYGGAVLASYAVTESVSLAGRAEYIASTGNATDGASNLLGFGAGSSAWSFTVTPTYQKSLFFVRGEASYVGVSGASSGSAFGRSGNATDQERFLVETGIVF